MDEELEETATFMLMTNPYWRIFDGASFKMLVISFIVSK